MYSQQSNNDTREVFDQIASGWYGFRHRSIFTPELEGLSHRWKRGRLLNIGCAHGPDFLPFKAAFSLTGIDFSAKMLSLAQKYSRKFEFPVALVLADAGFLPFSDNAFDYAVAIATYHHISGEEARLSAFRELHRVLKPGGEAFVTVWNRWQPRFWGHGRDTKVPWKTGEVVLHRYYHLFSYNELVEQIDRAQFSIVSMRPESTYWFPLKMFSRNICLLVRK